MVWISHRATGWDNTAWYTVVSVWLQDTNKHTNRHMGRVYFCTACCPHQKSAHIKLQKVLWTMNTLPWVSKYSKRRGTYSLSLCSFSTLSLFSVTSSSALLSRGDTSSFSRKWWADRENNTNIFSSFINISYHWLPQGNDVKMNSWKQRPLTAEWCIRRREEEKLLLSGEWRYG